MDTLGHNVGESVGLYECHGAGGNQVWLKIRDVACFDVIVAGIVVTTAYT